MSIDKCVFCDASGYMTWPITAEMVERAIDNVRYDMLDIVDLGNEPGYAEWAKEQIEQHLYQAQLIAADMHKWVESNRLRAEIITEEGDDEAV